MDVRGNAPQDVTAADLHSVADASRCVHASHLDSGFAHEVFAGRRVGILALSPRFVERCPLACCGNGRCVARSVL